MAENSLINLVFGYSYATFEIKRTEKRGKRKDEVKNELVVSFVEGDIFRKEELGQWTYNITSYKEAILLVKKYETIIRSHKKDILNVVYRQGIFFKNLKNLKNFEEKVKEIGIIKFAIYFS